MTVVVCADKHGGMLFNNRRTGRDKYMVEDLVKMLCGKPLFISPFSEKYIAPTDIPKHISESFLDEAGEDDICFAEDALLVPYLEKIDRLIIYRWDKDYPSDFDLDLKPFDCGFRIDDVIELQGFSHEIINKEIYLK